MHNYSCWINNCNPQKLKHFFDIALVESGFNILSFQEYYFKPIGYTGIYLLSESHLAIHTFPEESETYIELSSCVKIPFNNLINLMNRYEQGI